MLLSTDSLQGVELLVFGSLPRPQTHLPGPRQLPCVSEAGSGQGQGVGVSTGTACLCGLGLTACKALAASSWQLKGFGTLLLVELAFFLWQRHRREPWQGLACKWPQPASTCQICTTCAACQGSGSAAACTGHTPHELRAAAAGHAALRGAPGCAQVPSCEQGCGGSPAPAGRPAGAAALHAPAQCVRPPGLPGRLVLRDAL